MGCPHSKTAEPCAQCAASAPTMDDFEGKTFQREGAPQPDLAPHGVGARISRYIVLDVLGAGGMGIVYSAYDPSLDRRVAIKVLRSSRRQGSAGAADKNRLLREAQAMAQLSHPNVVPVYDVGTDGDSVFVAMELVQGSTLRGWLKQKRDWREVLKVLVAAGRGLEAAHRAGLVHRDFKPANVLLGADGQPKVTDFGLARSTRASSRDDVPASYADEDTDVISLETPLTLAGAVMGSPGYMAPEQYDGAATSEATDQYAFCVSAYEALYGVKPFEGTELSKLGALAKAGQVPPPPRGSPVPLRLWEVLKKGLSPDADDRHPSMGVLLDALTSDPRRALNQRLAVAAVVLVLAGAAGAGVWFSQRSARECRATAAKVEGVWNDAARAKVERAFTGTNRAFAGVVWRHTREAMDAWAAAWAKERVDACDATRVRREQSERQLELRLSCLDRQLDELGTLATAFAAADTELVGQANVAVAALSPASACANLKALEDRERLAPEAKASVERLEQQLARGRLLAAAGRFADARAAIEPAVRAARGLAVPSFQAAALEALGELEREAGRFPEAREALQQASELALAAGDDVRAARVLSALVSLVGWRLERPKEGLLVAAVARGVIARMGGDEGLGWRLKEAEGDAHWQGGDRASALASYRQALAAALALQGEESADVARLHSSVGWVLMEQGHLEEARLAYEKSRQIREKLLGEEHPSLSATWNELGSLAQQAGDFSEAARCFARGHQLVQASLEPLALPLLRLELNLVETLGLAGRAEEATPHLEYLEKALARLAVPWPSGQMQLARAQAYRALAQGRPMEGVAYAQDALRIAEQASGADHPDTAFSTALYAEALNRAGRALDALAAWERYLAQARKPALAGARELPEALLHSAQVLRRLKRPGEALARLKEARVVLSTLEGNGDLRAEVQLELADLLWTPGGDKAEARRLAREAKAGFERLRLDDGAQRAGAWLDAHVR